IIVLLIGCGGTSVPKPPSPSPGPSSIAHVAVVILENHSSSQVLGNAAMPYFNDLVKRGGLATPNFAQVHPSIGDYLMLTTGIVETLDNSFTGVVTDDNVVRALAGAGKSWKAYLEDLPSVGYTGGNVYPYAKHHNPMAYLSDVVNSSAVAANMVPFTQLA